MTALRLARALLRDAESRFFFAIVCPLTAVLTVGVAVIFGG